MIYIIIVFGIATLVAGIVIVINPELVFGPIRRNTKALSLHILAVVVRMILGALLIIYASDSKYPMVIQILGWLSVVAAVTLGLIGRRKFINLMSWALNLTNTFGRVSGLVAIL